MINYIYIVCKCVICLDRKHIFGGVMEESVKETLNTILKNNRIWPIVIEGAIKVEDFLNATFLSAFISSKCLAVINDINGPVLPDWVKQVEKRKKAKTNLLVITDLDKVDKNEQKKFKALLDIKQLNGYRLPENLQLLIIIDEGNREKLDNEILSLSLYYKI